MIDSLIKFALGALLLLGEAWLAMIALGAAHSHHPDIPAPAFITVLWVFIAISAIVNYLVYANKIQES